METLFGELVTEKVKKIGNPYHNRRGKYSDKKTAAKELAEKRADNAENSLKYISSCYHYIGKQYSSLLRENEKLKSELKQIRKELSNRPKSQNKKQNE